MSDDGRAKIQKSGGRAKHARGGYADALKEHLLAGNTVTRLSALLLFGVSNLTDVISEMRKQGWKVESRYISMAAAVIKINQHIRVDTPKNLPIKEIEMTEYWLQR